MNIHATPVIGYHHSPLTQKFGIPRQPNLVSIKSHVQFIAPYGTPDAFVGIERYSHLWILWQFHHNQTQDNFRPQVRPPRLGGNNKMGVFATRSMYRPSQIGLSVVQLDRVEIVDNQAILHIIGADMVDGTPIFDIKPYLPFADAVNNAIGFDKPMMRVVVLSQQAMLDFDGLRLQNILQGDDKDIIIDLIAQDPRPAYRQDEEDVIYRMRYKTVDVDFMQVDDTLMIDGIRHIHLKKHSQNSSNLL